MIENASAIAFSKKDARRLIRAVKDYMLLFTETEARSDENNGNRANAPSA